MQQNYALSWRSRNISMATWTDIRDGDFCVRNCTVQKKMKPNRVLNYLLSFNLLLTQQLHDTCMEISEFYLDLSL